MTVLLQTHFRMNQQLKAILEVSLQMASGLWFSAGFGGFALTGSAPHPRTSAVQITASRHFIGNTTQVVKTLIHVKTPVGFKQNPLYFKIK